MTQIVIHPATKTYLDYGSVISTVTGIVLETNGHLQRFEEGKDAKAELATWQAELAAAPAASIQVSLGDHVHRRQDLNPHGLI